MVMILSVLAIYKEKWVHFKFEYTGGPCNSRIFWEMRIWEFQNCELQATPVFGSIRLYTSHKIMLVGNYLDRLISSLK